MKGIKIVNYFNLIIVLYFQFELLTHLTVLKLNVKFTFTGKSTFPAGQILLTETNFDFSLRIKYD